MPIERRRAASLIVAALCLSIARESEAGRTRFGWLYGVETLPERSVELETWILEEGGKGDPDVDETRLWFAPVIGLTDRLELALPLEILYEASEGIGETRLDRFGAELHLRLADPDPTISGPFVALLRLGAKRIVSRESIVRIEPGVVLSLELGPLQLAADFGASIDVEKDRKLDIEARPGAGVSFAIVDELRLGAEIYAEVGLGDSAAVDWVAVGPNIAWTHGRFWFAASFPFGVKNIDFAPRLNWAIAF